MYGTEKETGETIKAAGFDRKDIWVTSKRKFDSPSRLPSRLLALGPGLTSPLLLVFHLPLMFLCQPFSKSAAPSTAATSSASSALPPPSLHFSSAMITAGNR